jgi:putative FmdB family regulatory protein
MPLYDFRCPECDEVFERMAPSGSVHAQSGCPVCGFAGSVTLTWTRFPGMRFKGAGCTTAMLRRLKSNEEEADKINKRCREENYERLKAASKRWTKRPYNDAENERADRLAHAAGESTKVIVHA